jgi:hypothetical protein
MSKTEKKAKKRGQEEMVGFAIIVIIVSVIFLVLLGFLLNTPSKGAVENYQVDSFIQASLQYTSSCENDLEFISVQNLIVSCEQGSVCLDGTNSCDVLNNTLRNLIESAWNVNNQSAVKGYKLGIMTGNTGIFLLQEGNEKRTYKGGLQDFAKSGENYEVSLNVYS